MTARSRSPADVGIGLVGCGRVSSSLHVPAIARVRGARVVALADRDAARLTQLAPHCEGATTHADYGELLADERVTLVAVCVPTTLHAEVAAAAFRARKHVFIEKPLALTLEDCDRLVSEAARAEALGVRSVVGFNLRSHRLVRQAREVIRSGVLGEIELLRTLWTADWSGAVRPVWHAVRAQGGGALVEIGAHQADLWRWLLDSEVESVHAVSRSTAFEDQTAAVQARMASGVLVSAAVSQRTTSENVIEAFGSRGSLRLSVYHGDSFEVAAIGAKSVGAWRRIEPLVRRAAKLPAALAAARRGGDFRLSYVREWEDVVAALRSGAAMPATVHDGRQASAVVLAALRSVQQGSVVTLTDATGPSPAGARAG